MKIFLIGDLGFCQHHHTVITDMDRLNGLDKAKALAVADVVRPKVLPPGAQRIVAL